MNRNVISRGEDLFLLSLCLEKYIRSSGGSPYIRNLCDDVSIEERARGIDEHTFTLAQSMERLPKL